MSGGSRPPWSRRRPPSSAAPVSSVTLKTSAYSEKRAACTCWPAWVLSCPRAVVAGVPAQVLQRQPARALHEAALDLPDVDQGRQALTGVVHDVHPPVR